MSDTHAVDFQDKVAVITGGASGIGYATAELLAARGACVVIADRNLEAAQSAADAIGCLSRYVDVARPDSIRDLAADLEDNVGPVALVVANAGIVQPQAFRPGELDPMVWDDIMGVDLRGVFLTCRELARRMIERRTGSIVNIASVSGIRPTPIHAYGTAKAGVIHLTQSLAAEWGPAGIRVNTVSPGFVLTPALEKGIELGLRDAALLKQNAALGEIAKPIEIARAIAFLLSDEASAITGVNLPVENGWLVAGSWHTYGGLRSPE